MRISEKFAKLDKLNLDGNSDSLKSRRAQRGRDFEALFLELCKENSLLLRNSFYTADNRSEQIDGAIMLSGRYCLVEAKWVESGLAASDLFSFIGKVENKFAGTIGLFISRVELSSNFLQALNRGRRQSVIVCHGGDVDRIFSEGFPLEEYLEHSLQTVSIDNCVHISAKDFQDTKAAQARLQLSESDSSEPSPGILSEVKLLLQQSNKMDRSELVAHLLQRESSMPELQLGLLKILPLIRKANRAVFFPKYDIANLIEVIKYIPKTRSDVQGAIAQAYMEHLCNTDDFFGYIQYGLPLKFFDLTLLTSDQRDEFFENLRSAWAATLGEFHGENTLTDFIQSFWREIPSQELYLRDYFRILNSSRRDEYPQKEFAKRLFFKEDNVEFVKDFLTRYIKQDIEEFGPTMDDTQLKKDTRRVLREFPSLPESLRMTPDQVQDYLMELWQEAPA